ncbi:MAG: C25 family cysteine peptidase, partial [Acidobacteria bacterium]|nr:C25 family cysteine peptidase [Acidobacteriota bacterium]
TVDHLSASSTPSRLFVALQAASDYEGVVDHHVKVKVNTFEVGEATWDGKLPRSLDLEIGPGVLREGENSLEIENVGDTGATSMVFLDRFSVRYPRLLVASGGELEGSFALAGQAEVQGLSATSMLLDTTEVPRWLEGATLTGSGLSFAVQAGRSYLATSAPRRPAVRRLSSGTLKGAENQADYLLLAPEAFLGAAQPLLDRRQSQGLVAKGVALEEVYEQFGHGEVSPGAIKEFLEYAYHQWSSPSPRYVLLLGDATYDPKDYLKTGVKNQLPGFPVKTSYLWTVSDPAYAAVNGEDLVPDIAVGRLPAASVEEASALVSKVLAYEDGGQDLSGRAVLVADNADLAGNFEQDADEIASTLLAARDPRKIYYSQLLGATRSSIIDAFDQGASLMSYMGHGGTAVWASELFFRNQDVGALHPQPQQPLLLTMNCL